MRDERSPGGFLEDEREGVERPRRSHPGEPVRPQVDDRLEVIREPLAEAAVDAVRDHHEIRAGDIALVRDLRAVDKPDAEFHGPVPQDPEKGAAGAAAEAVAADPMHRTLEVDRDVVPVSERARDPLVARPIILLEIVQRGIGEHHAEPEGLVGAVALVDSYVPVRPLPLQEDRAIEPRRTTADDRRLHGSLTLRNSDFVLSLKY
jgi:hypothetical protein